MAGGADQCEEKKILSNKRVILGSFKRNIMISRINIKD
jgi:hypothetical protein